MRPLVDARRVERFLEPWVAWRGPRSRSGRIEPDELLRLFAAIEPQLYRYPAIDPVTFRHAVEDFVADQSSSPQPPSP